MDKYRGDFQQQKKLLDDCPYCGGVFSKSDSHLDHIYPVSKGGLSIRKNLIFVCIDCNQKKGDLTLRNFIKNQNMDSGLIYSRLETLKKDF
jgi:5-methylcytosine-specific restriction endonuclease McrA